MERSPRRIISATAEASPNGRKTPVNNLFIIVMNGVRYNDAFGDKNHLYIDNIWNRHLPLAPTVLQHLIHPVGFGLHVIIDMLRGRLTGASGIGSALFSVNNGLAHGVPPFV